MHAQERLEGMQGHHASAGFDSNGHEINRVLGGYKATLHSTRILSRTRRARSSRTFTDPHASEEAKRHAREILEADGYAVDAAPGVTEDEHQTRVLAGYKAALHNPRVSEEAKEHAREFLAQHNAL